MTEIELEVETTQVSVKIPEAAFKRRESLLAAGKCLGCERGTVAGEVIKRGLCSTCYQAMQRATKRRTVSKTDLIKQGKLLTKKNGGRPPMNKFTQELSPQN